MVLKQELIQMGLTILWALVGAISMGVSLGVLIRFFDAMTPVNEWEEVRKDNRTMGIILGAVIVAFAIVVAAVVIDINVEVNVTKAMVDAAQSMGAK